MTGKIIFGLNATALVAVYVAIVPAVLETVTIYNWWRDRASVMVNASIGIIMDLTDRERVLSLESINNGRKPVTISAVEILQESGQVLTVLTNELPKEITEGKNHVVTLM